MNRYIVSVLLALSLLLPTATLAGEPPPLMLANVFHADVRLADYLASEKYDGIRGYWDGERLLTRGGEVVRAPDWFTAGWPKFPLDGELWAGRGHFTQAVSTVRQADPDDAAWRGIRFMVFDLPAHPGDFVERDSELARVVAKLAQSWVQHVEQFHVTDIVELRTRLAQIERNGGEGLVLHRITSRYRAERNDDLLKLKSYDDAEARVIAHLPGKGKYAGMLGALEVETSRGLRFKLGAGLSDAERRNPPPLGCWVTYRYNGLNEKTGIPRFARYLRVRADLNLR